MTQFSLIFVITTVTRFCDGCSGICKNAPPGDYYCYDLYGKECEDWDQATLITTQQQPLPSADPTAHSHVLIIGIIVTGIVILVVIIFVSFMKLNIGKKLKDRVRRLLHFRAAPAGDDGVQVAGAVTETVPLNNTSSHETTARGAQESRPDGPSKLCVPGQRYSEIELVARQTAQAQ